MGCFLSGGIPASFGNDASLVTSGYTLLHSPFNGLSRYGSGLVIDVFDKDSQSTDQGGVFSDGYNVFFDNNRFVIHDTESGASVTIAIGVGYRIQTDIASELQSTINITIGDSTCLVAFDATSSTFSLVFLNGRLYELIFTGTDTNGQDLLNSAAAILGFAQTETPMVSDGTTIRSSMPSDMTQMSMHVIKISTTTAANAGLTGSGGYSRPYGSGWSERAELTGSNGTSYALFVDQADMFSGTKFTQDLAVNDEVVLGTDYDQVFTIMSTLSDQSIVLDSPVSLIGATTQDDGTVVAAPKTNYTFNIYKVSTDQSQHFLTNEKLRFVMSSSANSTYDYDGRLTGSDFVATRISPIKCQISETDSLLEASAMDTSNADYISIENHNMFFIKNNSKYNFPIPIPATSSQSLKGGNPIGIGTGVKFRLLFSKSDTPGELLGFPFVGQYSLGDTDYRTVQTNEVENLDSYFNVVRSEPGTGNQTGMLRVITDVPNNFEFGDTVYIQNHSGSSNDLAVNNDEGLTITIVSSDQTFTEADDGNQVTRGVFYVPLSLTSGGTGGNAFQKKLYAPFALAGENYVYLTCPTLSSLLTTSNKVQNVFAKISLDSPPGSIVFDSMTASTIVYDEAPLATLEYFDFQIVDRKGELFDFNNKDWSAAIEITTTGQLPPQAGISSRTLEISEAAGSAA